MTEDTKTPDLPLERVPDPSTPAAQMVKSDTYAILAQMGRDKADADAMAVVADLIWKQEDREAEREMARDFAALQRDLPDIVKTKEVEVATKSGSSYSYWFEPLDRIDRAVKPVCHRHRFAYSWTSEIQDGKQIVTCILAHENGHSKKAVFVAPMASGSPTMSEVQKHASSLTYAKRQSLCEVLGITAADDTDGMDPGMQEFVTEEQAAELADLAEHPDVDTDRFLSWVGADDFYEIRAGQYETAKAALKRKRGEA